MTEKTVRPDSVLRRTMLVGTAGVLGGVALRTTPVRSQTGAAPAVAVPGRWGLHPLIWGIGVKRKFSASRTAFLRKL